MSTHTEGCFSRKSSGNSVYGIRWNHISFIASVLSERRSACAPTNVIRRRASVNAADAETPATAYSKTGCLIAGDTPDADRRRPDSSLGKGDAVSATSAGTVFRRAGDCRHG